jgi:hypothetical protein
MRYSVEVSGVEKVVANINKLQALIQWNMKQGLVNASEKLRNQAIANLNPMIWPSNVDDLSIRNPTSWDTIDGGKNTIILRSLSDHSAAVEFGTFGSPKLSGDGRFHAAELTQTGGPFPIGKSQGILVRFAASIKPQSPKSFLTRAMNNPTTMNEMINEVGKVLKTAIASVKG